MLAASLLSLPSEHTCYQVRKWARPCSGVGAHDNFTMATTSNIRFRMRVKHFCNRVGLARQLLQFSLEFAGACDARPFSECDVPLHPLPLAYNTTKCEAARALNLLRQHMDHHTLICTMVLQPLYLMCKFHSHVLDRSVTVCT